MNTLKVEKGIQQTGIMHFHSSSLLRLREYKSSSVISRSLTSIMPPYIYKVSLPTTMQEFIRPQGFTIWKLVADSCINKLDKFKTNKQSFQCSMTNLWWNRILKIQFRFRLLRLCSRFTWPTIINCHVCYHVMRHFINVVFLITCFFIILWNLVFII